MYQSFILVKLMPIWKIKIEGREKAVKGDDLCNNFKSSVTSRYTVDKLSQVQIQMDIQNRKYQTPFLGWYLRMAGYITINRGNEESKTEMIEKSLGCLKRGISIMLFPEGTRSPDKEIGFFKRGAFQLALRPMCRYCQSWLKEPEEYFRNTV